ncbi:MAG: Smr/MutS family protein, partial [Betaproteobacteria bacterium]
QHTQDEARIAVGDFFAAARRQGWRCVRIVHGKGLSSPNREPVLKAKVRRWLQLRDDVLAYCEPRPNAGGGGAVVVLLAGPGRP